MVGVVMWSYQIIVESTQNRYDFVSKNVDTVGMNLHEKF